MKRRRKARRKNQWICTHEKTILTSHVMDMVARDCRSSEDDRTHRFYLLRSQDWCNVIPVTEKGKIVLVKQFRIGINKHTLEIPGGVIDRKDKDPRRAALREMTEETGYVPLPKASCLYLGWTFPNPAIQNNRVHSFIVGPVRKEKKQELDDGELIETVEMRLPDFLRGLAQGKIKHALILNAFLGLLLQSGDTLKILGSQLKAFASTSLKRES